MCSKVSRNSLYLFEFKCFNIRKEEKRMLHEYNAKFAALIQEKLNIIRQLQKENRAIKEFKEVIIR